MGEGSGETLCHDILMADQRIQQDVICYQWFKQQLILSISKPSISHRSPIKEDNVSRYTTQDGAVA